MRYLLLALLLVPTALALDVPRPDGFVNDHAGMLAPQERAQLEELLSAIERNATVEIAVLAIPSLEGEVLEEYATRVFREWGVGKADVDNGVLILVVEDSRQIRIEVGLGLEGTLTDAKAGLIIRNRMKPSFQQGGYAQGLALAALDIAAIAAGDPSTVSSYDTAERSAGIEWIPVLALLAAYGAAVGYARRYKGKRRQRIVRTSSSVAFVAAWILTFFVSSAILWLVLFIILMVNVSATGTPGIIFLGGGRGGGGFSGGGFGGFGGGFSGGGGASGGW